MDGRTDKALGYKHHGHSWSPALDKLAGKLQPHESLDLALCLPALNTDSVFCFVLFFNRTSCCTLFLSVPAAFKLKYTHLNYTA